MLLYDAMQHYVMLHYIITSIFFYTSYNSTICCVIFTSYFLMQFYFYSVFVFDFIS
jgi:hypothetical protein